MDSIGTLSMYLCVCVFSVFRIVNETSTEASLTVQTAGQVHYKCTVYRGWNKQPWNCSKQSVCSPVPRMCMRVPDSCSICRACFVIFICYFHKVCLRSLLLWVTHSEHMFWAPICECMLKSSSKFACSSNIMIQVWFSNWLNLKVQRREKIMPSIVATMFVWQLFCYASECNGCTLIRLKLHHLMLYVYVRTFWQKPTHHCKADPDL